MRSALQIPTEIIENQIYLIRKQKIILDADLAVLYGVETKVLNQAVSRNKTRFPDDFMFQLNNEEFDNLKSQFVTSNWGGRRYAPYAFTEQGVAMLSSVLRSNRAVEVNIAIMRAFVKMREAMISHKELALKIEKMEEKYDSNFSDIFAAIRQLMAPERKTKHPIGYIKPVNKEE